MPLSILAQEATPTSGEVVMSETRDDVAARYEEEMAFSGPETAGGTLNEANTGDIQTIQPLLADDEYSIGIVSKIYQQLVGTDFLTGQLVPTGVADSWEIAPDGVTYTFHLNQDVTWQDGTDLTAADVIFSLDALANLEVGSSYSQSFIDATASWRAIDDDTVEIVAREPLFTFLYDIVTWIIPRHIWEDVPVADWRADGGATGQDPSRVVGSGPFRFREWIQGDSVTLDRNDDFFGHVPYIDTYILRSWPHQTAIINALLANEVDIAPLEPADVATIEGTSGLAIESYPTADFIFYMTNLDPEKSPYFQDVQVRQALLHALDRESIAANILLGTAEVAHGSQPVLSYAYAPDRMSTTYTYDVERARELLAEVGWTDSDGDGIVDRDGQPLAFDVVFPSGSPTYDQILAYMQDAWREIGVDMTPTPLEFAAVVDIITGDHAFDIALLGFGWDASFVQDAMFGCAQYEGGFNVVRYCNEEVDALNAEARRTFDIDARRDLLIEATDLVNNDLPVAVLHFTSDDVGYNTRLQNYHPTAWGSDITYVWIAPE
jgi:peptide/nickel transport system substrate-binding protein